MLFRSLDVAALLTTLRSRNWCERCGNKEAARCNCGRMCDRCSGAHMPRFHDLIEGAAQTSAAVQAMPWLDELTRSVIKEMECPKPKEYKLIRKEDRVSAAQAWVTPLSAKEPQANPPEPGRGAGELQITQRTANEEVEIGRAHV